MALNLCRLRLGLAARSSSGLFSFSTISPVSDDDFHPLSSPFSSKPSPADPRATIESDISSSDVFLYMKGVPSRPQCGFSQRVAMILSSQNVPFKYRNILEDDSIRQAVKEYSDWPTIPQLYVKGKFIGGADIVSAMYESGELLTLLKENKVL